MFLPIGDTPNPRGFVAWVTWLLLAANVGIYLLLTLPMSFAPPDPSDPGLQLLLDQVSQRLPPGITLQQVTVRLTAWDLFVQQHGYKPGAPELVDLFGSMFLHGGFAHLAGNMLFLWIYGDNVEHRLGRLPFLLAYLGTGVAATLAFSVVASSSLTPLVGASGAISGVLGLYFLLFPHNRVKVLVALFPFVIDVFLVPAPLVLGVFVLVDNLLPLVVGTGSGVAYGAHLGGFLAGLALAWWVRRSGFRVEASEGEEAPDLDRQLRESRDPVERARLHATMGELLARDGHTSEAFQHAIRALKLEPDAATRARVERLLGELPLDERLRARLGLTRR